MPIPLTDPDGVFLTVSAGLAAASPVVGVVMVVGGATALVLTLLKFDQATLNEPSYLPTSLPGLLGRGIDIALGEASGPGNPLGPFQTPLDAVGFGFKFAPKSCKIDKALDSMVLRKVSPPSPIVPTPPGPWPK